MGEWDEVRRLVQHVHATYEPFRELAEAQARAIEAIRPQGLIAEIDYARRVSADMSESLSQVRVALLSQGRAHESLAALNRIQTTLVTQAQALGGFVDQVSTRELLASLGDARALAKQGFGVAPQLDLPALEEVLRASSRPLIDPAIIENLMASSRLVDPAMVDTVDRMAYLIRDASQFTRLASAFEEARFVGGIELTDEDATEEEDRQAVDAQLVKIAPPEALEALRCVDLEPILLLDRALRNPELMYQLGARDFEKFVAALVEQLGFEDVNLTPPSGDGGRDILALKRVHGLSILFAFECKRFARDRPVGPEIARALLGTISHGATRAAKGILVTTSHFTPATRQFIVTEPLLDGRDFDGIVEWLREYGRERRG